jgi:twinkle protein
MTTTKSPCPACRAAGGDTSGDNLVTYEDDGHSHCFSCNYHTNGDGSVTTAQPPPTFSPVQGEITDISDRGIWESTCRKFGVKVTDKGTHIYPYYDQFGKLVGQHLRRTGKKFSWKGETKGVQLFGQHLWQPNPKLRVTLTEGELDALSVSQAQNNKYPVVSIPNGVSAAARAVKDNIEFLEQFESVVICFDMDEPGQKAAQEVSEILSPGKARIAHLPRKDANEMLMASESKQLLDCLMTARVILPEGVQAIKDVTIDFEEEFSRLYEFPWDSLTDKVLGRRPGELWILTAGTGCGKTTFEKEMIYHDIRSGYRVGVINLEESVQETKLDLCGVHISKPVRRKLWLDQVNKIRAQQGRDPVNDPNMPEVPLEEVQAGLSWLDTQPLFLYHHSTKLETQVLLNRMRYLFVAMECDVVYLDHLSYLISSQRLKDERQEIDNTLNEIKTLTEEVRGQSVVINHLRKPDGKSHEEGGTISADDLRGSGGIKQLANGILGLERVTDDPGFGGQDRIRVRVIKDRLGGFRGVASTLGYSKATGRLTDAGSPTTGADPY